jgi:hypothetical protein
MGLNTLLSRPAADLRVCLDTVRYDLVRLESRPDGGVAAQFWDDPRAPPGAARAVADACRGRPYRPAELLAVGSLLAEGVKAFRLTARQCEALEETSLTLDAGEYAQPFPTFAIDLPADYAAARVARGLREGEHRPAYLVLHHRPADRLLLFVAGMEHGGAVTGSLVWVLRPGPGTVLEDCWGPRLAEAWGMTEEEAGLSDRLIRLGLNVALLADACGTRSAPDPALERRRRRAAARLARGRKTDVNLIEMARVPTYLTFDQEVTLYQAGPRPEGGVPPAGGGDEGEEAAGRRPHWRRGHWRMQPCGEGRRSRRRVRIPPVLVNAHRLAGEVPGAAYTFGSEGRSGRG